MTLLRWLPVAAPLLLLCAFDAEAGADRRVPAGGNLQQTIDEAHSGDRILLEPGVEYVGNFFLPVHEGSDYITITTDPAVDLPPAGHRISPEAAPQLAKLRSPNTGAALRTLARAHHWRIQLVEFPGGRSSDIILLGDGTSAQRSLADIPHDLVIDRCYIHGDSTTQKRGITLNSARTSIIGSYITGIARPGQDTQAIGGSNGPGPYLIENNWLEAAGENFMLGGALPTIDGLVPSDVTFRRNYVTKPLAWRGRKLNVKNLFELKNARRVLVEFNVFEHSWVDGQTGYAIVLTPRGERGRAPWATVQDVTFRYNIVRHAAGGVNVLGRDNAGTSGRLRGLRISNNLFYDIDGPGWGGAGAFLQIGDGPADIVVEHNTVLHTGTLLAVYGGTRKAPVPILGVTFRDNLARHNRYGVHGQGRAIGKDTLDVFLPGAAFTNNVLAGGKASLYPPDNFFPSVEEFESQFVDPSSDDFRLKPDSAYRDKASDGTNLGADIARILDGVPDTEGRPDRDREGDSRKPKVPIPPAGAALVVGAVLLAAALR